MISRTLALAVIVAVALALAAALALPTLVGNDGSGATDVPVYRVERGDFVHRVHAEGILDAVDATLLGPPPEVSQALKIAWLAPDGSPVSEGQVVIRFDPTEMEEDLRDGRHDRETADSRITGQQALDRGKRNNLERDAGMASLELDYAQQFQSRDSQIFSRTEIIESEIDQELATHKRDHAKEANRAHADLAQSELDLLDIERHKAEIKIEQAEQGLDALEVRTPHAGIFLLRQHWSGLPEVGQTVWAGNAIAEIPKLEKMKAEVYVLEADAGGLEAGQSATMVIEAHPDHQFAATVQSVDALAQRRNRRVPVQYFHVTLQLAATEPGLMKPGQRVRSTVTLNELEDVLTVPRQAVFEDEGQKIIYRRDGDRFKPVKVKLGETSLGRVVIEEGLDAGDLIALRDPTRPIDTEGEDSGNAGAAATMGGGD